MEQKKMAKILATGPDGITLMFKNQMWEDEKHWLGILEHILSEGFPKELILMCHRGFAPGRAENPRGLRNLPDFEMAMRVKEKTALPMLLDPSHIAGQSALTLDICREAHHYAFDGYLVEMHSHPESAKTDAKQQLSPNQFQDFLQIIAGEKL